MELTFNLGCLKVPSQGHVSNVCPSSLTFYLLVPVFFNNSFDIIFSLKLVGRGGI